MLKRSLMLLSMTVGLWLMGCAPRWTVISQATPNPFLGKKEFVVMPIDYTGLKIGEKSEEEYLSGKEEKADAKGKDSNTRSNLEGDKAEMSQFFQEKLKNGVSGDGIKITSAAGEITGFVIKPHIGSMEPGYYAYVAARPSRTVMRLKIEDKDGKLLDEIEIVSSSAATMTSPAAGTRYRSDAKTIGDIAADYILSRVMGE